VRIPFEIPDPAAKPFDVVGLGLNSVDLVVTLTEYPISNSKQPLQGFARLPGGQTATAVAVCAKLGWRARYVGSFGEDEFGHLSRQSLERIGIDVSASRTIGGASNQFAIVLVDQRSGERTVLWQRDARLVMDPAQVSRDAVTSGCMLLVDCHDTAAAARAAQFAREAGIATVVDVEKVRPGIHELLRHIDAIIAAESFPTEFTGYGDLGRALEAIAREFHAPLVSVTLGNQGSLARCDGLEFRTPAFQVDCVDSTGAGDAFRGGFAAACLLAPRGDIEDALRSANAVAALNCRALGARGGIPTVLEVDTLMRTRSSARRLDDAARVGDISDR
jgi:sulfofructose kinase